MNRKQEIDNFLKYFAQIYEQNPKLEIFCNTFYHNLMQYDIRDKNNEDIKDLFPHWINAFNSSQKLNVFHSLMQKHFLQFHSFTPCPLKTYKLYLSFPKDKIFEAVIIIYNFIEENNMITHSKVADMIRSDAIVLRMSKQEDTEKLINFINSNSFLNTHAQLTNPFLMRNGIIGYAYDDMLSYNSVVCTLLEYYFKDLRNKSQLEFASVDNFSEYIKYFYQKLDTDSRFLQEFITNQKIDYNRFNNNVNLAILNYKEIIYLIYQSTQNNMSMNNYYQFVENCKKNIYSFNSQFQSSKGKNILDEYIKYAIQKYGINESINYLQHYLNGNINGITRDNDFRDKFRKNLSPHLVNEITNGNIYSYIQDINLFNSKNISQENYELFIDACIATYNKYNYEQLYNAINNALMGNYRGFTNDGQRQLRYKMFNAITPKEIGCFINIFCKLNPSDSINIDYFCNQIAFSFQKKASH